LYSLVLRGRLDTAVVGAGAGDGAGVAGAGDGAGAVVSSAAGSLPQVAKSAPGPGREASSRLSVAVAVASLVIGAGLLVFAGPAWAHGIGAVFLLACAVTVFGMAVAPGEENL
jgi:hypothetical protein